MKKLLRVLICSVMFVVVLGLLTVSVASAAPIADIWTGGGTDNLWTNSANWNAGVMPGVNDPGDLAFIVDGAIKPATVNAAVPSYNLAIVGQGGGDGQIDIVTGGAMTNAQTFLGADSGRTGTLNVFGGSLSTTVLTVGNNPDIAAPPSFANVSGGTVTVADDLLVGNAVFSGGSTATVSGGSLTADQVKVGIGSAGILDVTGGTLTAANTTAPEIAGLHVGLTNTGTVNHSAGTVTNTGNLSLGFSGQGTYNLSGTGQLDVSGALILSLADNGADGSALNQSGGTVNSGVTVVGRFGQADFNMSGGTHNAGELTVSNSDLLTNAASAGSKVTQTGGTINTTGNVDIGISTAASYALSSGSMNVGGHLRVSVLNGDGVVPAGSSFTMTGGNVQVTSNVMAGAQGADFGTGNALFEISDGTFGFDGQILVRDGGTFRVMGDAATITDTTSTSLNGMSVRQGTLDYVFNATGVSEIDLGTSLVTRRSDLYGALTALDVDGTNYTGGPATFTLVSHGGYGGSDFGFGSTNVFGFGALSASIVETANTIDLVIIPEPTSVALIGIGGLVGLLAVGRRRRA